MADPILANVIRVNAVLQNANGLPEDRYVNSFVFTGAPAGAAAVAGICVPLVQAFYNTATPSGTVAQWLGPQCSRAANASKLIWYDLGQAPVRTPHEVPFTLAGPSGGSGGTEPLPGEVALVLTLLTDLVSARGRGRLYIGPFNQAGDQTGPANDSEPSLLVRNTLCVAAARLADAAVAAGCSWQVLSRAGGFINPVVGGYVDNAWDTQRRRGRAPTTRTPWAAGL